MLSEFLHSQLPEKLRPEPRPVSPDLFAASLVDLGKYPELGQAQGLKGTACETLGHPWQDRVKGQS